MKVFLGGTVADSTWRDELITLLTIEYFNPVVEEWDEAAYQRELYEREHCDFNLYVITPKLIGYYSIAEVIDDAMKKSGRTIYCFFSEDGSSEFSPAQIISLEEIGRKTASYGAVWARSLQEIADFLNYAGEFGREGKSNEQIKLEADYFAAYKLINQATEQWIDGKESKNRLWSGTRLSQGLITWKKLQIRPADHLPELTTDMHRFIDECIALNESSRRVNLFISYSRNPSTPLARGMYEHLKEKYDVWYDKVSIPHGEDFKISIEKGIRNCDNFLYIISTRAVLSPYCQAELDTAKAYGKRIIPIQQEMDVENDLIDEDIRDINRIFPEETGTDQWNYESLEDQIYKVASLEEGLVSTHTNFLRRGVTWKTEDFNTKVLMYDEDIRQYEKWSHEVQEARLLTNPITPIHQSYYTESLAFSELGYREFWIAGEDLAVEKIVRDDFSVGSDPRYGSPDKLFKAMNFLFILNDESATHTIYREQLQNAREHGLPIFFVDMGVKEKDELFEPLPDEKWIDGSDGLDDHEIELLKSEVAVTIGTEFRYYKSPGYLTMTARHWSTRNKQNSDLMRGSLLSYFLYYQQTYRLKLSDTTREYLEASTAITDHRPYDVFICRQKCKLNFSIWLSTQMLDQKLTSWNQQDYLTGDITELKDETREGIKNSLNFVLILSQDQGNVLEDEWIMFQLEEAQRLQKRIFIVKNDPGIEFEELEKYQTVDFTTNPQQASFELINLLTTDQAFMKFFNEIFPTALQWSERKDKSARDLLLSGFPLENAENQLEGHEQEVPETFKKFIEAGRKESNARARRKRALRLLIIFLAIFSTVLAIWAEFSRQNANEERHKADIARKEAEVERHNAEVAKEEAEESERIAQSARDSTEAASKLAIEAQLRAEASENVARQEQKKAQEAEEFAEEAKRNASKESRLANSQLYAYQIRNTEPNLLSWADLRKAIYSYYLHENDSSGVSYDPNIFTALFKIASVNFLLHDSRLQGSTTVPRSSDFLAKDSIFLSENLSVIKSIRPANPVGQTLSVHYLKRRNRFVVVYKSGSQTSINQFDPINGKLESRILPGKSIINGSTPSPDEQFLWLYSSEYLFKYNLKTNELESRYEAPIDTKRLVIASNLDRNNQVPENSPTYILASRGESKIYLHKHENGILHPLDSFQVSSRYSYPQAIDICGVRGGYLLSYGEGAELITRRGKGYEKPKLPTYKRLKDTQTRGDHITSISQKGFRVAIGTKNGGLGYEEVIVGEELLETRIKAKSVIKKVIIGDDHIAAVSYGNQFENSRIILNNLEAERTGSNTLGMAHIELEREDVVNDIGISGNTLFYILNSSIINYHTLKNEEIINALCGVLDTRERQAKLDSLEIDERKEFFENNYEVEKQLKGDPAYEGPDKLCFCDFDK